ncbi:TonB-dependent receptor [Pedobacter frigiditerrae]|uniref:SusC/RagA family TonB-linked outer membrane protein n=1 Tax=Pedobacter frigiditerrae TaxID=2530452 RepID=UPI0029319584|nr:TonB-dependent receptor [Pedobacter frigiditerrae]
MNIMQKTLLSKCHWRAFSGTQLLLAMAMLPISSFAAEKSALATTNSTVFFVQQTISVKGTVVDEKGLPLPGVGIKVKNGTATTTTDGKGQFSINLENANATLVFTMVGFKTNEVAAANNMKVVLAEEVSNLDNVVVIGYGTVKKKDLTGAVSSVKSEDITLNPVSSPMEALQGRVAGLDIQRTSGQAGQNPSVLLRGNRSITVGAIPGASQNPLYVIDGIIGSITSLNPNDIETIDVLKDASSTAIYGVAGANGVIMITTKKAKAGKVQVDVNSYYGINGRAEFPKALSGDAWLTYINERYFTANNKYPASLTDAGIPAAGVTAINNGQWIDWVDETLRDGSQQNHHISVRGGSEKTQAYMSLGYIDEKGIYQGDESKFYNIRGGVDVNFSKFFKAGLQTTANLRNGDQTNSRINKAYGVYPLGSAYNADGTVNALPLTGVSAVSPIANYANGVFINNTKSLYLAVNPYVEFTPIKNLSIRSNLGLTLSSGRQGTFANERSYNLLSEGRTAKEASYENSISYNYLWENIINYNWTLANDHQFTVTGITSLEDKRSERSFIFGTGLEFDDYSFYNLSAATLSTTKSTGYIQQNRMSFAGRINYNYKGKYLFQASNRWDGVSQLIDKWSSFPSVSAAWRISEEKFMDFSKAYISNLKLRAGYGVAGNPNIPAYTNSTLVASRSGEFPLTLGGSTALPLYSTNRALGNDDLTWERSYNFNLGLDVSLFNNRIDLTGEYFNTKSKGVLYPRNLPPTDGGFDAKNQYYIYANIAETKNAGFELTISSRNIETKGGFKWNSAFTFTRATEELTKLDLGNSIATTALITNNLFVGSQLPQSVLFGYKKLGVWQLGEEVEAAKYGAKPGDVKLATVPKIDVAGVSDNGVHAYSAADRMILGHNTPNFSMGLQNTFTYKGFDLTVFMTMRYGQTINAQLLGYWNQIGQPASYNYWTPSNPTNDFPRPTTGTSLSNTYISSLSIVDGSYFKVKNITLGYSLPAKISSKAGFSRIRLYGTAYNSFVFAKSSLLKDIDPETAGSDSFPLYRQMVFGLNASF